MKLVRLFLVFSIFMLAGCASAPTITSDKQTLTFAQKEVWNLMIGTWFVSQPTKEGGVKRIISELNKDGTYKIRFRTYDESGNFKDTVEVGFWGVSGDIYFSIFRGFLYGTNFSPSDPSDPYNYDAYRILELNETTRKYKDVQNGNVYTSKKVPNDFIFPE